MNTFQSLGLSQPVIDAIADLGFEEPTAIQTQAIPRLLQGGTDLIGLAQTGTGKTAAFGLPLVELVDTALPYTQALVIAPTRELCLQISRELSQFGQYRSGLRILPVYGGADISRQMRELKKGIHILAATPGRLRDLMRRKSVDISRVKYLVLDEADEMLNMGFKEEIDEILEHTPREKDTWLFSATMPEEVRRLSKSYMVDPFELSVSPKNTSNNDISHQYVLVHRSRREEALRHFLDYEDDAFALVFVRTRRDASDLAEQLTRDGYNSDSLHGDLSQSQRDRVMEKFRNRRIRVLVATDVAARGIDVDDITHVFHYNIPEDLNFYTHRAGRTGRAGRKGISLVLASPKDQGTLRRIEKRLKMQFEPVEIPSGKDVFQKRLLSLMQKLKKTEAHEAIEPLMPAILEELDDMPREELLHRLASMMMSRQIKTQSNGAKGPGLKAKGSHISDSKELFINVGGMDVEGKSGFLALICGQTGIPGSSIGKINLSSKHTFFQVEEEAVDKVIRTFDGMQFQGRALRVNAGSNGEGKKSGKKDKKGWKKKGKKGHSWKK